jgi:hypothetical protein
MANALASSDDAQRSLPIARIGDHNGVAIATLCFWTALGRKPETKQDCSRFVSYVHSPFDARLPISIEVADKLAAGCYRLSPRGGFIGKVDPFIGRPDMPPIGDLEEKSRHAVPCDSLSHFKAFGPKEVPHRTNPFTG